MGVGGEIMLMRFLLRLSIPHEKKKYNNRREKKEVNNNNINN